MARNQVDVVHEPPRAERLSDSAGTRLTSYYASLADDSWLNESKEPYDEKDTSQIMVTARPLILEVRRLNWLFVVTAFALGLACGVSFGTSRCGKASEQHLERLEVLVNACKDRVEERYNASDSQALAIVPPKPKPLRVRLSPVLALMKHLHGQRNEVASKLLPRWFDAPSASGVPRLADAEWEADDDEEWGDAVDLDALPAVPQQDWE